jgi:putative PIN family toxin of toxin-antitoxin system
VSWRGITYDTAVATHPTVVLDTNVLEAAMRSRRGASFAVLSLVGDNQFDIALSVPLVMEYEEVLMRQTQAGRSRAAVRSIIDYLCAVAKRQEIFFLWRPCLADPNDDMLLELAVAAECDTIVTYNRRDFGPARQFGIRVLTPVQFLHDIGVLP